MSRRLEEQLEVLVESALRARSPAEVEAVRRQRHALEQEIESLLRRQFEAGIEVGGSRGALRA